MVSQQQIDAAKKYYTQAQIDQELANPWSIKRKDAINNPNQGWTTQATTSTSPTLGQRDLGIWPTTTIQKTPEGTLTSTAPWYGSQSVGWPRLWIPSAPQTTTLNRSVQWSIAAGNTGSSLWAPASSAITNVIGNNGDNTTTTNSGSITPDNTPWIVSFEELSSDMQTYLDNNPLARSQFDLVATQGKQQQDKFLTNAAKAVMEFKKQGDYTKGQTDRQKEVTALSQGQQIQQWERAIAKATQNQYYSAVSPVSSSSQQTAAHTALRDMAGQLDTMVAQYWLQNDAFAAQTAENARRIQLDLDQKIGETLSKKLQDIDNGVANGTIATPEQLDRIFKENSAAILKEIPELTNFAVQQMSDLTTNFMNTQKEARARQDLFQQNKNTYNPEMSQVTGFATDGNGNPILDTMGRQITVPKDAPMPPQFDEKTGQLITFSTNENGTVVGTATKVSGYTPPAVEPTKRNVIMVDGKPYDVDKEQFLNLPWETTWGGGSTPYTPPTGFESRGAGQSVPVINTGDGIEIGIPSGTKLEGVGGQCGGLVNDFATSIQWYKRVGDTWESKLANKNSMQPVEWGLVMWTPWKFEDNGHIGIVEKVFADGSFQIYDTNYVAANTTSRRVIKPWDAEYNLIQKTGWFFDPTKVGGQGSWDLTSLAQYMKDNQDRGQGYSNDDVKAFNEKIDRMAKTGDEQWMAVAYRNMVMKDKDFKKEFDDTTKFAKSLDTVEGLINDYEAAGKSTSALKAMAEKVGRKIGLTTDEALARMQTQLGVTLADYIRSISGTAASDVEVQRLMGNMANIGNVKSLNTAIVWQVRENAMNGIKQMIDNRMYGLPEELKPQVFGDIYTTATNTWWDTAPTGQTSTNNTNPLGI